jgi:hypothetical protein
MISPQQKKLLSEAKTGLSPVVNINPSIKELLSIKHFN